MCVQTSKPVISQMVEASVSPQQANFILQASVLIAQGIVYSKFADLRPPLVLVATPSDLSTS